MSASTNAEYHIACVATRYKHNKYITVSWSGLLESIKNGLKDNKVNKDEVSQVLSAYESQEEDWIQYAFFDGKCYTRNLVDVVNGNYNLVIMGWNPGQKTNIHNHSGSGCFNKILSGALREIRYKTPEEGKPFKEIENHVRERNSVSYIEDSIAVHQLINESANQAVSLHLFIPTLEKYQFYDKDTAEMIQVPATFTSTFGVIHDEGSKPHTPKDTSP